MLNNKRGYDFSSLGSGKTASAIWFCDMLFEAKKIKKVLVVCPLSIMQAVWGEEIREVVPNRSYSIVHGSKIARVKALAKDAHFYITNHDALRTYYRELQDANFDIIIIDEVDAYKNPTSKRSKGAQLVTQYATAVYGLTGTPMANSPMEAFGIAKTVNPNKLPTPYKTRWQSMTMIQYNTHTWVANEHAEELVYKVLQPAIRHKLEDCVDIPPITYEYREFKMGKVQAKAYKEMVNHQLVELDDGLIIASTAAVKYTKLLQISAGAVYTEKGDVEFYSMKEKIDEVLHVQKEVGQLIIFVQFIKVADYIGANIPNSKIIYGSVSQSKRAEIIKEFREGKFDVLIAQPRVAAHGLNLQFCSTIIFWTPILGNSYYRQAIGRIRRSNQKNKQVIINFFSSLAEKRLYKTLEEREISSQLLLDMYKDM